MLFIGYRKSSGYATTFAGAYCNFLFYTNLPYTREVYFICDCTVFKISSNRDDDSFISTTIKFAQYLDAKYAKLNRELNAPSKGDNAVGDAEKESNSDSIISKIKRAIVRTVKAFYHRLTGIFKRKE